MEAAGRLLERERLATAVGLGARRREDMDALDAREPLAGGADRRGLDGMGELADVARPFRRLAARNASRDIVTRGSVVLARLGAEVGGELDDVERRSASDGTRSGSTCGDRRVLAETPLGDRRLEVDVGRGDDADVGADRRIVAPSG